MSVPLMLSISQLRLHLSRGEPCNRLLCTRCGRTRPMSRPQRDGYIARGMPRCCDVSMSPLAGVRHS